MRLFVLLLIIFFQLYASNIVSKMEKITIIKAQKFIDLGEYNKALTIINKALKKYPNNDKLLTLQGQSYKEMAKLEEALVPLRKALSVNPDNVVARTLIQEIDETLEASKNKIIEDALAWLSDKGVDFLMIFFGVLGGELLAENLNSCRKSRDERYIMEYISKYSESEISYEDKKIFFRLQCIFIYILIYLTVISVAVVAVLMVEILIDAPYLKYVNDMKLWTHIGVLYVIITLFIAVIKFSTKEKKENLETYIADMLTNRLNEHEIHFVRDNLKKLSKLGEKNSAKVEAVFNAVLLDDDRVLLKEIYQKKIIETEDRI